MFELKTSIQSHLQSEGRCYAEICFLNKTKLISFCLYYTAPNEKQAFCY